jgi:hypothetical protein
MAPIGPRPPARPKQLAALGASPSLQKRETPRISHFLGATSLVLTHIEFSKEAPGVLSMLHTQPLSYHAFRRKQCMVAHILVVNEGVQ